MTHQLPSINKLKLHKKSVNMCSFLCGSVCEKGSAMVAVMVILAVALLAVTVVLQNVLIDTDMSFNLKKSDEAYNNAISAIDESILRIMRDPSFAGTNLIFDDGSVIIDITGDNPKNINIVSRVNNNRYICKVEALATFNASGILIINNIEEIY